MRGDSEDTLAARLDGVAGVSLAIVDDGEERGRAESDTGEPCSAKSDQFTPQSRTWAALMDMDRGPISEPRPLSPGPIDTHRALWSSKERKEACTHPRLYIIELVYLYTWRRQVEMGGWCSTVRKINDGLR